MLASAHRLGDVVRCIDRARPATPPTTAQVRRAVRRRLRELSHALALAEIAVTKEPRLAAMYLAGSLSDGTRDLAVIVAAAQLWSQL